MFFRVDDELSSRNLIVFTIFSEPKAKHSRLILVAGNFFL